MKLNNWPEDEHEFKKWLLDNAEAVLRDIGIREGMTVLDYGCNKGAYTIPTARIVGNAGRVFALDINEQALAELHQTARDEVLTNIETIQLDACRDHVPETIPQLDVVLLFDVLQVIDDKYGLLKVMHSLLKEHGLLSIFPMHVGVKEILELVDDSGLFSLKKRVGMLLHLTKK